MTSLFRKLELHIFEIHILSWMTYFQTLRQLLRHLTADNSLNIHIIIHIQALSEVLPAVAQRKLARGGFMILRPDSGDPVEAVLLALDAAEKVFGVDVNRKGYKVPVSWLED